MIFPNSNWNVLARTGKCFDIRISKYCQMFTFITITQKKCLWKKTGIVWFNASKCVNYLEHLISSQLDFVGNIPKSSRTPSFQLNQTVKLQINSNIVKLLVFCNNIWCIIWTKYTTSFGKYNRNKTIECFLFLPSLFLHTGFILVACCKFTSQYYFQISLYIFLEM